MKLLILPMVIAISFACNSENENGANNKKENNKVSNVNDKSSSSATKKHYEGEISNGMKGDKISFDVSADGKKLENLTFIGYWRCSGKLEQTTAGPEGSYDIVDGKVNGHISEPPGGGSTSWRFDLEAVIDGNKASGSFRMNINNLGCDTYKLNWTATSK